MIDLASAIRDVPDFPVEGVLFKDITTLLKDAETFRESIEQLTAPYRDKKIDLIAGIESRGFIFGSVMAYLLGAGFIPIRKPGKLPAETVKEEYALEYGTDAVEMHKDAIRPGHRVLLVDDLLATGGTAAACTRLIEKLGGEVVGVAFLIDLTFLHGKDKLEGYDVYTVIEF
jgi:adenine phosphoribosyltransferase